jgi:hypothetical protein
MSAFIVSYNHINTICNYINRHQILHKFVTQDEAEAIGRLWMAENVKSVNNRYSEDDIEPLYCFSRIDVSHITPIQFIKLLDCLEYQSCEHDDYRESEAYIMLSRYRYGAIGMIEGYQSAAWAIG